MAIHLTTIQIRKTIKKLSELEDERIKLNKKVFRMRAEFDYDMDPEEKSRLNDTIDDLERKGGALYKEEKQLKVFLAEKEAALQMILEKKKSKREEAEKAAVAASPVAMIKKAPIKKMFAPSVIEAVLLKSAM